MIGCGAMKVIDLNKNIYDLAQENNEFAGIMKNLGFDQIANPVVRGIVGRKMTIPLACKMRRINIGEVINVFESKGFEVINKPVEDKDERTY